MPARCALASKYYTCTKYVQFPSVGPFLGTLKITEDVHELAKVAIVGGAA